MQKKNKIKISAEVAIGIILFFSIIVSIAIYRAGSFTEVLNYMPKVTKKKEKPVENSNWVLFAQHGERKVYKVQKDNGQWAVVIDGQEGEAYDEVFGGVFSDDGEQFAYGARDDEWEFVVLNNKANDKKYSDVGQIIFDHNGVLIYKVIGAYGEFLVIDGQEGIKYDRIGEIVILDDGRVAFQAEVNGETVTVINGQIVTNDPAPINPTDLANPANPTNPVTPTNPTNPVTPPPTTVKNNRQKKDTVIPVNEKSYPICEGVDCNF